VHDPLTGLLNRRGLHEALERALSLASRDAAPLALMFIDLDDFKRANDLGGHSTGDEHASVGRGPQPPRGADPPGPTSPRGWA